MEGNEDLSSNRDQSYADQDMVCDEMEDDDGFEDDSYGDLSDYDDEEDSSALIEILPRAFAQNLTSAKGPPSINDNISVGSHVDIRPPREGESGPADPSNRN